MCTGDLNFWSPEMMTLDTNVNGREVEDQVKDSNTRSYPNLHLHLSSFVFVFSPFFFFRLFVVSFRIYTFILPDSLLRRHLSSQSTLF